VDPVSGDRLQGTWELVSYESIEPDGRTRRPFGDATGRITYDGAGNMAGQVMRPGRTPVDSRGAPEAVGAAYAGYIAYFGRYEVGPSGDVVVHHVSGALNPAMVGKDQIRTVRFDGERLVLEAEVRKPRGIARHVLTWQRLS
jgi:hypothetical protein